MDEIAVVMRKVWSQEPPVEGYLPVGPAPIQVKGIPLVAGVSGLKALARVARWADGVSSSVQARNFNAEALAAQRERVMEAWKVAGSWQLAGRERSGFSAVIWFALGSEPENQLRQHMMDCYGLSLDAEYSHMTPGRRVVELRGFGVAQRCEGCT